MMEEDLKEFTERFNFEKDTECQFMYLLIKPGRLSMDFKIMEHRKPSDIALVRGYLKWDGCMNWRTDETMIYHYCGIEDAEILHECFKKLYELGEKHIERWERWDF